ncbi:tRNA dimethylallyltransferase, mitochondrial [Coniosporium tulheliwenetii]|uniref:tRNA dimethylallyltransferase, mitochondrial n=1 Tax=Coniosporium tulheliwenetii TaxID=3383036 RepID=A0ACC2YUZ3_9PEZI|nr:tRNA dimethylallyltransferase, mitochondrial [Cladosporium sp. JES 115]
MARSAPRLPLVAILGATGTGKSQLAVDLASRFNGEIINGDAMQLYKGLPIITNKIPLDERNGIPHHLLGCIGLDEETWTVSRFVKKALGAIEEIRSRGRLPILVGGTHYYTQSLLFKDGLADEDTEPGRESEGATEAQEHFSILEEPTEIILEKLRAVDPVMADRWHPNERRKIQRSLEIWLKTGKRASQVGIALGDQAEGVEISEDGLRGTQMRFPTLMLWVHSSTETLYARLDARVGKMFQNGLLSEVNELDGYLQAQKAAANTVDRTRGIWVSIGYKEFEAYQAALRTGNSTEEELQKLRTEATEKTRAATRQYAKRQVKWIRTKLLHALTAAQASDNLFLLDGSDLAAWKENVEHPAFELTSLFLDGAKLPEPHSISEAAAEMLVPKTDYDMSQRRDLWKRRTCEVCNMTAVTESDWSQHIKSRSHRRAVSSKKKRDGLPVNLPRAKTCQQDDSDQLEGSMESFEHLTTEVK